MTYDDDDAVSDVVLDNPTTTPGGTLVAFYDAVSDTGRHDRHFLYRTIDGRYFATMGPGSITWANERHLAFWNTDSRVRRLTGYEKPFGGRRENPVRPRLQQRDGEVMPPTLNLPIRQLRAMGLPAWLDYGVVVHDYQSEDPLVVLGFDTGGMNAAPSRVSYVFVENTKTGKRDYVSTARLRRSRQQNPVTTSATKRYTYDDLVARLRARGIDVERSRGDEPTDSDLARLYGPGGAQRRANPEPEAKCEHACSRRPNPSKSDKENPIVKGDEASFLVVREKGDDEKSDDEREIRIDPKLQVVHDPDEKLFSKCDAMFVRVIRSASKGNPTDNGDPSEGTDKAQKYYPSADLTPDETLDHPKGPWQRVAKIDGIRYRRWFDEHEGKGYQLVPFEHHFEKPCVLEATSGKRAYRLRLGSGCVWDERGLVIP